MSNIYCEYTDACMDGVYCKANHGDGYHRCLLFPDAQFKCDFYRTNRMEQNEFGLGKDDMKVELDASNAKNYILGGRAVVTIQSGKTGKHFTYKFKKHSDKDLFFVKLLVGDDNNKDYRYVGCYFADTGHLHLVKPYKDTPELSHPASIRALSFLMRNLETLHPQLHVYHSGRCARCGRLLTTPESIKKGLGPECERHST